MNALPSSVEASLIEAGFSGTEILILKRLLEERAMTLRQLAAKTGKSTGVLDQAMKKLTKKKIVTREMINGSPKFVLESMQAIVRWMHEDTVRKREVLLRKYQDFESFIATLDVSKDQPEMEYFNGMEGIENAYRKLLELPGATEILRYVPVHQKEEEDPLRDFRVQWFRDRRSRGIFSRVIAYDTPLGRRFQSRDLFEYRKTLLVKEQDVHIGFEKIVAGDVVACFNLQEGRACFIRYPELAAEERTRFEQLWRSVQQRPGVPGAPMPDPVPPPPTKADAWTKILSGFREFFLNPKSLVAIGVLGLLSAGITYGIYAHTAALNLKRIQERVVAIAATASSQFDTDDLDQLRVADDVQKPEYRKVVLDLLGVQRRNPDIAYAYVLHKTDGDGTYAFVAASDGLDLENPPDSNGDGVIDDADEIVVPGFPYDLSQMHIPPDHDFRQPVASAEPYSDQWGTFITGYAPIWDKDGNVNSILAVDIRASQLQELTKRAFAPISIFLGLLLIFLGIRFFALNRSLYLEITRVFNVRLYALWMVFIIVCLIGAGFWLRQYNLVRAKREAGERLMAIATTAAQQFDAKDLDVLRLPRDMRREEYQRVFKLLNEIRNQNKNVKWAYIWRPTEQEGIWEFVADADANFYLPGYQDWNADSQLAEEDEAIAPGTAYDIQGVSKNLWQNGLKQPTSDFDFMVDQWGTLLTSTSPIYNAEHKAIAVLGLDTDASDIKAQSMLEILFNLSF